MGHRIKFLIGQVDGGTGDDAHCGCTADILTVERLRAVGRTFREVDVPVYGAVGMPGIPEALLGMAAFRDQGLLLDIGGGALYRTAQLDLTVVQ